jgi:hypothetical protein
MLPPGGPFFDKRLSTCRARLASGPIALLAALLYDRLVTPVSECHDRDQNENVHISLCSFLLIG